MSGREEVPHGKQRQKVHSVEKAMRLLDCFWEERTEFSLAELAEKTGWPKSTVHALLGSMLGNATVQQDEITGRYRLGYHAFELGCVAQARWDVRRVAAHYMRAITDRTGESLYLGMRCLSFVVPWCYTERADRYRPARPLSMNSAASRTPAERSPVLPPSQRAAPALASSISRRGS